MTNKQNSIKKEIFLPSIIGDWTTYTAEKNKASISITKSIGTSNKTISENTIEDLLFFHQEFFEDFFNKLIQNIDSHIELDRVSINILNHKIYKENQKGDIYISKFSNKELEQLDFILSKKTAKFIAHRLCGGTTLPEVHEPTSIEISLLSVVTNQFFTQLTEKWKNIFNFVESNCSTTFGHYTFSPQQSDNETIIELSANFKLFNHHDLNCKLIYSLDTIERLLFYWDQLNKNIVEKTTLKKNTLKHTKVDATCVIGSTTLSLNEIENLEIGDIVLIEDKKINDPIQLFLDNDIVFNAQPVQLEENKIGVQIINSPQFDNFKKEGSKPTNGPFIHDDVTTQSGQNTSHEKATIPADSIEDTALEASNEENLLNEDALLDDDLNSTDTDFDDDNIDGDTQNDEMALDIVEEPAMESPSEDNEIATDDVANDEFSWDDLDDE